jgi:hypothetical protein
MHVRDRGGTPAYQTMPFIERPDSFREVRGRLLWDSYRMPEEVEPVKAIFEALRAGQFPNTYENHWTSRDGGRRLIAWSNTALLGADGEVECVRVAPASTSPLP